MKIVITVLLFAFVTPVLAQQSEEVKLIQQLYGMEKKEILSQFVEFPNDEAKNAFWEIYEAYETQRKVLGQTRMNLLESYVKDYMNMPEAEMATLLSGVTKMNSDYVKLLNSNVKKIQKKVGVKQAAQFYQIENYLNNAISVSIAEEIPFIGELD
ncbi:hypothetical protein [Fulvivirga sedimenti]|uniref:Uncharacterized protein n=1 Tax=Fulvivirga sedimenti TaxID=2879465 RepID=A0A9X1KWS6_9BACT|nr:hypothetical protein [Fulvivirga sedimenti]MCA6074254.1 hypothetical protein [Fulvivirga sedimenti]